MDLLVTFTVWTGVAVIIVGIVGLCMLIYLLLFKSEVFDKNMSDRGTQA